MSTRARVRDYLRRPPAGRIMVKGRIRGVDGEEEQSEEGQEQERPSRAGERPLLVILDEQVVENTKIAAIVEKRTVSAIVEELLRAWLAERKERR